MSATGDAPSGAEAGFTLIEMLTTVGVAALVSALIFPSLAQTLDGMTLLRAQAGVGADLRAARARAILLGRPVTLTIDRNGAGYVLDGQPRALPDRIQVTARDPIAFFPDGSSIGGRVDVASGGRERALSVDPVSGLVRLMPTEARGSEARP